MPRHRQARCPGGALALALVLLSTPALAADPAPVQQELQGVRQALEFGQAAQKLRQEKAAKLQAEIQDLQQRLVAAAGKSRDLANAVGDAEQRLSDLMVQGEAARYRLRTRQDDVAATLKALVRLQRQPPMALLLHHDSIVGAARGNRLLAAAVPYLRQDTAELRLELDALAKLQGDTEAERERVHGTVAALAEQRTAIDDLLRQRREHMRVLSGDSRREQQRLDKLATRADSLTGLLRQLKQDEARRRREEADRQARLVAAERARREAEQVAAAADARARAQAQAEAEAEAAEQARRQTAALARPVAPKLAFSAARGRLTLPVSGRTIRRFGERDEVGTRTQGVTLLTRAEAEVVAPHDGHIAFSGPFRDYGVLLIIAHGEGYHTLLAGLAETYVEVGQSLLAGEPVGHMGSGKNRTLYVELRLNGDAINPHPWWASNGGKVSG